MKELHEPMREQLERVSGTPERTTCKSFRCPRVDNTKVTGAQEKTT